MIHRAAGVHLVGGEQPRVQPRPLRAQQLPPAAPRRWPFMHALSRFTRTHVGESITPNPGSLTNDGILIKHAP